MIPKYLSPIIQKAFSMVVFICLFYGIYYLSSIIGILKIIFSLSIYSLFLYIFYSTWKKLRRKEAMHFGMFLPYYINKVANGIFLSVVIIGGFSYYYNFISPTPIPTYHLSNGSQSVVFQTMSHIGTHTFYKTIQTQLIEMKKQGYVYYFEGVKPGTQENMDNFNKEIGIEFDKDLYRNFSKLYGVTHQDNSLYFNLVNNLDYNIDLSIDEIMKLYSSAPNNGNTKNKTPKKAININADIIQTLAGLNTRELSLLRFINKALLNSIIGSPKVQKVMMNNFGNIALFDIILHHRNELLAQKILSGEHKKIFITYGLLHFEGVLKILQKEDPKWKIISFKNLYPIQ